MFQRFIHENAESDLENLWDQAPQAAARITVLLEELEGNQDLLDRRLQHDLGVSTAADFHVSKWVEPWRRGRKVWRLKVWVLENKGMRYRIVYAFVPGKGHYHVLGVVPRGFDYDADHPINRRILAAYDGL